MPTFVFLPIPIRLRDIQSPFRALRAPGEFYGQCLDQEKEKEEQADDEDDFF
jgi:hypothetical protein